MESTSKSLALSDRHIFYFRQRLKNRLFQSVIACFARQAETKGLTKRDLALRLKKDPAQLTRLLSGSGNWTLDTVSELLLAMDSELEHHLQPLSGQTSSQKIFFSWDNSVRPSGDSQTNRGVWKVKAG